MLSVPIQPVATQVLRSVLGDQNCQINLYQREQGLFFDLYVDGTSVVLGIIARDGVPLVCRGYVGFIGNLMFIDTQGYDDPNYIGLGSRYVLLYLSAPENEFV